jgi:glycosyltransferase involved in cell wall biosynthesis
MSVRIVHCATTHRAGDPRIFQKECRSLAAAGYDVVYVVPHDRDEVVEGVQLRAVPVPRDGRERLTTTVRAVYERALSEGPEAVIHLHDSDLLVAGLRLKRRGRRVVYDTHEDTPKQMRYQHWIPRALRPVASGVAALLERVAGRAFDGIIAAEPENARRFPPEKTVTVHNFPIVEELLDPEAQAYELRQPVLLYVGSITRVRGLDEMMQAAAVLNAERGAELVLAGPFHPASLEAEVSRQPGVRVTGYLTRPQVAHWIGRARVGLVVLHPTRKYLESYPTKLFEYMAAGLPVVASNFPVWHRMVEDAGCGLTVNPRDPVELIEAVRWILDHPDEAAAMGARGQAAVREHYDWSHEAERLVRFYHRLAGPSR